MTNRHPFFFFSLLFLIFFTHQSFAQRGMDLTVTVKDLNGRAMSNTEVSLTETVSRKVLKSKTDAAGKAVFSVREGNTWQMDILKIRNYYKWQFIVPARGIATKTYTCTYDLKGYERNMRPPVDRSRLNLKTEQQNIKAGQKPGEGECIIRLKLYRKNKSALADFPVQLTCYKLQTSYQSKTNYAGEVLFKVPDNNDYEVDLEGIETYTYVDVPKGKTEHFKFFVFEPMNFKENIVNDTVTQVLSPGHEEISSRYSLKLICLNEEGSPCPNKLIHLKEKQGKKVYKTTSDAGGNAWFMLPKGKSYEYMLLEAGILSQTVEVVDLTRAFGIGGGNVSLVTCRRGVAEKRVLPKNLQLAQVNDVEKHKGFFSPLGIDIVSCRNQSIPHWAKNILVFEDADSSIGIKTGFLLTTGTVLNAIGPNDVPYASAGHSPFIVNDLPEELKGPLGQNYDASILTIEFIPQKENLQLSYLLASEEYPEFIQYDDVMGIYLEGEGINKEENMALLPDGKTMLSIKGVNHSFNPQYYIANDKESDSRNKTWQYDGFTKRFSVSRKVIPGKTYKLTLIITDRLDSIYDSGMFVGMEAR